MRPGSIKILCSPIAIFDDGIANVAYWVIPAARDAGVASRCLGAYRLGMNGIGFHRPQLDHSTS
ncbi:hypothetical protein MBT84_47465 [Streptomyces sp. MBT84]|uniref:hypothetical protein n=1 Tax=Streptomyces sp. MBT84 TaxID=1488414 RepID=UPI001D368940|nr:hypothetical protein [Streptomyces sp. MBT84]MBW8707300.1 hypothetical protein [Streptomyces sp. MBT84]